jgi:SAM-dependent methyltransferase
MSSAANVDKLNVIDQNIAYYNEVAVTYNSIIDSDETNGFVRQKVKDKFLALVKSGTVLDFGGGTGLDLEWLTAANYKIYFCEPSDAMRNQAINYYNSINPDAIVEFLDEHQTDFRKWPSTSPFPTKFDGILSNFGVINYIPGISALFQSLAGVVRPGGHFVGIMLDLDLRKRLKWHRRNAIRSLFLRESFKMYIPYKQHKQAIFVHTASEVKKASAPYFTYVPCESLKAFDFTLIHLVRNEKPC